MSVVRLRSETPTRIYPLRRAPDDPAPRPPDLFPRIPPLAELPPLLTVAEGARILRGSPSRLYERIKAEQFALAAHASPGPSNPIPVVYMGEALRPDGHPKAWRPIRIVASKLPGWLEREGLG